MSVNFIEINLRPGPKKKRRGARPEFKLPDFKELVQQVKDPLLVGAVASWVVSLIFISVLYAMEAGTLEEINPRLAVLEDRRRDLREEIEARQESDSLLAALASELSVIRQIDGERYVWPHIMEAIAVALPQFTWLIGVDFLPPVPGLDEEEEVNPPPVVLITGRTSDMQAYTGFLRRLDESSWLTNVVGGATAMVEEEGRSVLDFSITVTFRRSDSFATVPVLATVEGE